MLGRPSYLIPIVLAVCLATSTYGELVARWPLSGNTQDVVRGHHGTLVGGAAFVQDPDRGTALQADGTSGHVLIPHADHIGFVEDRNFSVALWVKPASLPRTTWTTVLAKNRDIHYNNAYGIWISPENQWHFRFGAASGNANQPNAPAATAQWNHLAMTHDPATTTLRGYLNGVLVYQNTTASPGTLGNTALWIGGAGGVSEFYPGLIHEVQIYDHALTVEEIQDVMLGIGMETELAGDPHPADNEDDVPVDPVLHWTAGEFAATHDVYFGTAFADVNDASRNNPLDVLVSRGQTGTMFEPGLLNFGQTYYWRIDEVNSAPDFSVFKGNVWSFTAEPLAYSIQNVTATSNGIIDAGAGPENTVDGSGLDAEDRHSIAATDMWLANLPTDEALYIQFEFDRVYKLHEMLIWNYNVQFELVLGFGLKDVTVEYSIDDDNWAVLGDVEFAKATARADYVANTIVDFGGVAARFIRLTVNSGWGPMGQFGLSEVRFLYVPAQAREPQPADGAMDVDPEIAPSWRAGRDAMSHDVYLGTDAEELPLVDSVVGTSLAPDELTFGTTYYWRVDAVSDEVWTGDVWSFSTQEYAMIDGFEAYTDDIDAGEAIFDTWIDGWVNNTGSTVGYLETPFTERTIVRSGRQSMPLLYDNTSAPFYSETSRTFDSPQDWTVYGADTLRLFVAGRAPAFAEAADGTILMNAIGNDIWGNADQFRYVYKNLNGNGSITACVDTLDISPDIWVKGGVMIRQSTEAGAINVFMAMTGTGGGGSTFQQRMTAGGASVSQHTYADGPFTAPYWVRVTREGNTLRGYTSPDGENWTQRGDTITLAMTDPVLIGLALTSHNVNQATSAQFSNVAFTGNVTGTWQVAEVGVAQPEGNTVAPLYVVLEDATGRSAVVTHPDANIIGRSGWNEWQIPLSDFSGVNLSRVDTMTIGIGNRTSPTAGGNGVIYVDDIAFGKPATGQ
ncbi:LamG-like jellyroll fold domain-containing protein [Anaerobaca lacustris]|uniref:F5/8 type C domain-containing protein n=1 Tax=Anaerobaca lacustris TaxID=3044600 RepID=A0AAW6U0W7_9BACT|nr:hypothetical protein [Sedimentisphaerales bacterium M17dextr]